MREINHELGAGKSSLNDRDVTFGFWNMATYFDTGVRLYGCQFSFGNEEREASQRKYDSGPKFETRELAKKALYKMQDLILEELDIFKEKFNGTKI